MGNVIETHEQKGEFHRITISSQKCHLRQPKFPRNGAYEKNFHAVGASRGTKKVGVCLAR